jgi:hypothetical protein
LFGYITPPDILIEDHEKIVANILARLNKEVEFLPPANRDNTHTPDIKMDGLLWEIKSPKGKSSRTIENNLRVALKQSENIILYLGRIKLPEARCLTEAARQFELSKKIKRLLIITKQQKMVDLKR